MRGEHSIGVGMVVVEFDGDESRCLLVGMFPSRMADHSQAADTSATYAG